MPGFFESRQIGKTCGGRSCLAAAGAAVLASMGPRFAAYLMCCVPLACGVTPLDSVVAERVAGVAGGGEGAGAGVGASGGDATTGGSSGTAGTAGTGGTPVSPDCQKPSAGLFRLRDRAQNRCVQKGVADTVLVAVFHAFLDADCESLDAQWELREVVPGFFAIYNTGVGDNLDVRAGATTDGTPIVLYMPRPSDNQLFAFGERAAPYYALEPQNATAKCVEVVGTGAQLFPCDESNEKQEFTLERLDCAP